MLWLRFAVLAPQVETPGITVTGVVAREVLWDGILIGEAGTVGTSYETEQPGPIDAVFRIPDSLATPGTHQVAVRLSSFRRPPGATGLLMNIVVGDFTELRTTPLRSVGIPLLFLGGFVIIALYYGALFLGDRRRLPYLFTALLCLAVSLLLVTESWRPAIGYTYDLHTTRIALVDLFTGAVGLLLSVTFAIQFNVPGRWKILGGHLIGMVLALMLIKDHETGTYIAFAISLVIALSITGWAAWKRLSGARLALAGVVICMVVLVFSGYDFMEEAFFPAFGVLVAGLLTSVGLQIRDERWQHARTLATAARLENELLKKHLQPHFLMNTLTSIMEWVETNPSTGVKAIEALAAELRTLNDVSGEKQITMAQELALCNAHLEVMGYRQGVTFNLDAEGVDKAGNIPPAVIHTLIENAVTHNAYPPGEVTFVLREKQENNRRQLSLQTPLAGKRRKPRPEGSGLQYVRARLEEAAPGAWSLQSGEHNGEWVTRIELPYGGKG